MNTSMHRTVGSVKRRPESLDVILLLAARIIMTIQRVRDKVGSLYQSRGPRICKQRDVGHIAQLTNGACGLLSLPCPFLNVSFGDNSSVMYNETAISGINAFPLPFEHNIKLVEQYLVGKPLAINGWQR